MAYLANRIRIRWKMKGFRELRQAPGVRADLERRAEAIAAAANRGMLTTMSGTNQGPGEHYQTSSMQGRRRPQGRWRTTVITADMASIVDNARNNTLLKALHEGGDG